MRKLNAFWPMTLITAAFINAAVFPKLESIATFLIAGLLGGLALYFQPVDKDEKRLKEIELKCDHLQDQLNKLFIKVGFKLTGT